MLIAEIRLPMRVIFSLMPVTSTATACQGRPPEPRDGEKSMTISSHKPISLGEEMETDGISGDKGRATFTEDAIDDGQSAQRDGDWLHCAFKAPRFTPMNDSAVTWEAAFRAIDI